MVELRLPLKARALRPAVERYYALAKEPRAADDTARKVHCIV